MNNNVAEPELSDIIQVNSPGKMLADARQKMGLSQQQVADSLHLRLQSVISIELDQLEDKVSFTFSKGYVRLYAKLVNIDERPVIDAFNHLHDNDESPSSLKMQSFSRRVEREANDSRWNLVTYVVIFFVLASLGYWWYDNQAQNRVAFEGGQTSFTNGSTVVSPLENNQQDISKIANEEDAVTSQAPENTKEADPTSEQITSDIAVETTSERADDNQVDPQPAVNQENEEDVDVARLTSNSSTEDAVENDTEDNVEESITAVIEEIEPSETVARQTDQSRWFSVGRQNASPGSSTAINKLSSASTEDDVSSSQRSDVNLSTFANAAEMTFTFSEDCWLSVTDATEDAIAYGIKTQGYVMNISGIPPISINLCPPERVKIMYNGQTVDLNRFNP
ncbi:MAG: RodZ domain-containing protein, partial [Pseudomonadota bacterium]